MKPLGSLIMLLALSACNASNDREAPAPVPAGVLTSSEARERGRALFVEHCALCHGENADGHGARRMGLSTKPANFQSRDWRAGVDAAEVHSIVANGKAGTSMPGWPTLSDDEKWAVVAYVLGVSEHGP